MAVLLNQLEFGWGREAGAVAGYAKADLQAMAIGLLELNEARTVHRVSEMAQAATAAGLHECAALWTSIAACLADIESPACSEPVAVR